MRMKSVTVMMPPILLNGTSFVRIYEQALGAMLMKCMVRRPDKIHWRATNPSILSYRLAFRKEFL